MAIKKGAFDLYTQERKLPEKKSATNKASHFFDDIDKESKLLETVHKRFTKNESEPMTIVEQKNVDSKDIDLKNGSQIVHKWSTEDTSDFVSIVEQESIEKQFTDLKNGSQIVHERFTSSLKESQQNEKSITCFSKIIGIQRAVVIALYKNMKFNNSDTTNELTLEAIASLSGVNQKSLKNTLFRLNSAGIIFRSDQKNGRSGWVKYKICPQIREEIQKNEFSILKK